MAYDPVHQSQLYLRRTGQLLRRRGVLPEETLVPERVDEAQRERLFDTGYKQVAMLARDIEIHTGCTLESRRALDYGCGMGRTALPLAERCEYVYGVDVLPSALREADRNARRMNLTNVEWMDAGSLDELSGRYDLVLSMWVFQHIPSREGERVFTTLLRGLRPGGVGVIHMTIRPTYNPFTLLRSLAWRDMYLLMNSYSLNRVGGLLADEGVTQWHARWHARHMPVPSVTLIFRKD
jgi:2-polyprenyl-3-methyl-5-hydroxy-6-metoxy-1,4-benzoquinol methylase